MSIWGKIVRAPGHTVDKMAVSAKGEDAEHATKNIAFTIGVIVLGAKMAKADGKVTDDEPEFLGSVAGWECSTATPTRRSISGSKTTSSGVSSPAPGRRRRAWRRRTR